MFALQQGEKEYGPGHSSCVFLPRSRNIAPKVTTHSLGKSSFHPLRMQRCRTATDKAEAPPYDENSCRVAVEGRNDPDNRHKGCRDNHARLKGY